MKESTIVGPDVLDHLYVDQWAAQVNIANSHYVILGGDTEEATWAVAELLRDNLDYVNGEVTWVEHGRLPIPTTSTGTDTQ